MRNKLNCLYNKISTSRPHLAEILRIFSFFHLINFAAYQPQRTDRLLLLAICCLPRQYEAHKGTVSRDFRPLVFFTSQLSLGH
jgi:hypothetical protein